MEHFHSFSRSTKTTNAFLSLFSPQYTDFTRNLAQIPGISWISIFCSWNLLLLLLLYNNNNNNIIIIIIRIIDKFQLQKINRNFFSKLIRNKLYQTEAGVKRTTNMGSDSAGASKKSFSDGPEILPFQPEFFILDGQKLSLKHMGFQDLVELFSLINQSCLRSNARGCLLLSWIWAKAAWKDPTTPQ